MNIKFFFLLIRAKRSDLAARKMVDNGLYVRQKILTILIIMFFSLLQLLMLPWEPLSSDKLALFMWVYHFSFSLFHFSSCLFLYCFVSIDNVGKA